MINKLTAALLCFIATAISLNFADENHATAFLGDARLTKKNG